MRTLRRTLQVVTLLGACSLLAGAAPPPRTLGAGDAVSLNIPDRKHAPGAPEEGWCAESALQQALLYYGAYFPQRHINRIGRPAHPDLYAGEIPATLERLGVRYQWATPHDDLPRFMRWIRSRIQAGQPVFAGVKIHPSKHPEWGLDHFVLVVGYDGGALTLNTTWGQRARRTHAQLGSTAKGLAFANRYGRYYAMSVAGPRVRWRGEATTRMVVEREGPERLEVSVRCQGLQRGAAYELHRASTYGPRTSRFDRFVASGETHTVTKILAPGSPAVFRCVRVLRR